MKIAAIGVPLALIGYLVWIFIITPQISCGPEVDRVDDQCIGVTDGRVALSADLADVLDKIRQENERVEREDPQAVSIAHVLPLPKPSADAELAVVLRHELEGAHIAQLQANRTRTLGEKPLIRLLVANPGEQSSHRQQVVPALLAKVNGPERLVAAVVTGTSVRGTIESIDALRSGGVPVVTSRLAGDSLTTLDPDALANVRGGLARMAPTGSDQAAAAAAYLKPTARRALIVRDTNPDDIWLQSIDESFRRTFADGTHTVLEPPETYNSKLGGVANAMRGMLRNICVQKPDVVYFAGRTSALAAFVQALPARPCPELPINIVAGADAVEFVTKVARNEPELRNGLNANASVRYTGQAHPESWTAAPESYSAASTSHFRSTCDYCFNTLFPGESLEDAGAIVGHDAIVTAVTAIRPGQGSDINDEPDLVSQEFKRLHGIDAVPGAGGWISLDPLGNPVNKAVVILQVNPDGTLKFLTLSSSLGSPCVPGTPPC
ncbi:MAG: hypothetical protein ACT4NY_33895 [Pseudonocardiales bacterium]